MSKLVWLGPVVMLLLALAPLPYGYYTMLRFVVCGIVSYLAWRHYELLGLGPWTIGLILTAILFNPIIPIHLPREVWAVIDAGCAVVLLINMRMMRKFFMGL